MLLGPCASPVLGFGGYRASGGYDFFFSRQKVFFVVFFADCGRGTPPPPPTMAPLPDEDPLLPEPSAEVRFRKMVRTGSLPRTDGMQPPGA